MDSPLEADAPEREIERLESLLAAPGAAADLDVIVALHFRAAQIALVQGKAGRGRALEHLRQAWQIQPENQDVLLVLLSLLEEDEDLVETAALCRRAAEGLRPGAERINLLGRAAELLDRSGDSAEALRVLELLASSGGTRLSALRARFIRAVALSRERAGDVEGQILALTLLLDNLRGEERYPCALQLARLSEGIGDDACALRFAREALGERPASPEALEIALRRLEAGGDHAALAEVLTAAGSAEVRQGERTKIWHRLAQLYESALGQPRRGLELRWQAWLDRPDEEEGRRIKERCSALQDWDRYYHLLQREALAELDPAAKVAVLREIVTFQREVLQDAGAAAETYGLILHLYPADEEALAGRLEIFEQEGQRTEAEQALRRFASRSRDPRRRDHLRRRLALLELDAPGRGNLLPLLRELDPTAEENQQLLDEIGQRLDPVAEGTLGLELGLLQLRMAQARGADATAPIERILALAAQLVEQGDAGQALDCCRQILELHPDHQLARSRLEAWSQAREASEPDSAALAARAEQLAREHPLPAVRLLLQAAQMAAIDGAGAEAISRHLQRATALCPAGAGREAQVLEEALGQAGMFEELVRLLAAAAAHEPSPVRRHHTLRTMAEIYQARLGQPERAVQALEEALALDAGDGETAARLRQLYLELGNHQALGRLLESLLPGTSGQARVALLEALGRLYVEVLDDSGAALSRYGELLSFVPDHPEAIAFCRAHDEAAGNHRAVAVLLCRAAEVAQEPLERAELHREVAVIAERQLADFDFAITQWRQVVELCPTDAAPRLELRRMLAQAQRWREVETTLLMEVSRTVRPEEKVPLYRELSALAQQQLGDDRMAAGYLRLAHQLDPRNVEILASLEEMFEHLGRWRDLAAILRRHAGVIEDVEERAKILHRAARVLMVRLRRDEEALDVCRQVREMRPGDRVAATLMGEIFAKRGQWTEMAALLEEQISDEEDPQELGRLHFEMGHLQLERMNDAETASRHFARAMGLDGGRGATRLLICQLYESRGEWEPLGALLGQRAEDHSAPAAERAAALCEIGRIRQRHQDDPKGAREAYERATLLDPSYQPALAARRDLAERGGQWHEVVSLARRELEATEDQGERTTLLLEISQILETKLERRAEAMEALVEAQVCDPDHPQVVERLASAYFEAENWEGAAGLLEKIVGGGGDRSKLHEHHYRLGFACEQLGREDDAFAQYVKSFGREPMYLPTLDRLGELCFVRRQWDNTLRIAEAIVTTYEDRKSSRELAQLHCRIGLCEIHLAQREVALQRLQRMTLDPGDEPLTSPEAWLDTAESWAAIPLEPHLLPEVGPEVFNRVIRAMERALAFAADLPEPVQVLAAISLTLGEDERALRYLDRAAEMAKGHARLQVALLICAGDVAAQRQHSVQRAEGYYRRALALHPGSFLARERLSDLEATPSFGISQGAAPPREGPPRPVLTPTQPRPRPPLGSPSPRSPGARDSSSRPASSAPVPGTWPVGERLPGRAPRPPGTPPRAAPRSKPRKPEPEE